MKWVEHLKDKWNIKSNWDFILIMVVFSLAGMSILYERRPIFTMLGITQDTSFWIKTCVYIPIVIPLYQLNLIVFGFIFGQFDFFWEKEKQMGRFFARLFTGKKKPLQNP